MNIASATTHAKVLRIAYTPDSDDVFNYYAWEQGRIALEPAEFHRGHISELNQVALEEGYDVVAVSSVAFPRLANRFWILATGNSVGRKFGPVLVSKRYRSPAELRGKRVAVAGILTTGGVLAQMYCPDAHFVEMPYTKIADAILRNKCDAGVMIHEEIFHFPKLGLKPVCSLAHAWQEDTGLPLPVGLNLVRKKLGIDAACRVADACQRSYQWGTEHRREAIAFARQFGRGLAEQHVESFSNEDTLRLPADVCRALGVLFARLVRMKLAPRIESFEVVSAHGVTKWEVPRA